MSEQNVRQHQGLDQTTSLRQLQSDQLVRSVAITGGKGGVGKTNIALNIGILLSQMGQSTLLFDADLSLANVNLMLGLKTERNLANVLRGECYLNEVIVEGPHGLKLIPASSGMQMLAQLQAHEHAGLINAFNQLSCPLDYLIIDTAPGISDSVLHFSMAASDVIVVVCDEPTSIADAYALMKVLHREHGVHHFSVIANMVRQSQEGLHVFNKLSRITDHFLDVALEYLGEVPFDERVRKAVQKQKAVSDLYPNSDAAQSMLELTKKIMQVQPATPLSGNLSYFMERALLQQSH